MNLAKIRILGERYPGGIKRIASEIGMSESALHRCMRCNSMKADDLEKVARLFNVSIAYFSDEEEVAATVASNDNQSGGNSYQSGGGEITVNNECQLGKPKPPAAGEEYRIADLKAKNYALSKELETMKKLLNEKDSLISALRSQMEDKDRIIALLSR